MLKLNVGSGPRRMHYPSPEWTNVDILSDAQVQLNVAKDTWPWHVNGVDYIRADNILEHFDNDELLHFMQEAYRVLKPFPEGVLWAKVPDAGNWFDGAAGDPTHKRFFVWPRSFQYFQWGNAHWKNYGQYYGFPPFAIMKGSTDKKFITVEMSPHKPYVMPGLR